MTELENTFVLHIKALILSFLKYVSTQILPRTQNDRQIRHKLHAQVRCM